MSTFGEELRRERELREISLREVSQATKISMRYLEAMERNDFAYLPGGVFNRGFVRAYCQFIGVDSEAMVNAYLLEERAQAGDGNPGGEVFRRGGADETSSEPAVEPRPWIKWGLVALVLLALAVSVWVYVRYLSPRDPSSEASTRAERLAETAKSSERSG